MQWTDKLISDIKRLASEGYTRREAADKLGISYNALKAKSRRSDIEFQPPMRNEYDADGTQSSETVLKVVRGQRLTPEDVMRAHGYDPEHWRISNATSNFWKQTPEATLYQSKIRLAPRNGLKLTELSKLLNSEVKPVTVNNIKAGRHNLVIPLFDLHFGITTLSMLKIRLAELLEVMELGYKHIVIELGGDLLHSDFMATTQTVKGTQLDHADTVKAWSDAKQFVGMIVEAALQKSTHVSIRAIGGNHDFDMQWAFVDGLADRYPQVSVHNTIEYRQAFRLDHVGIMMAHGDTALRKLPMLFATEYSDIWATSTWREAHYGHYHHEVVDDDSGVIIRQMGTPKPSDNYEKKNGYTMSRKSWKVFEYDDSRLRVTYDI